MSETPRTWTLQTWYSTASAASVVVANGPKLAEGEELKVYEASTVDAERGRMLDVIEGLLEAVGITNLIASTVPEIQEAEVILREHHRLPREGDDGGV